MTVAVLYDIHGNLPALVAVLDEIAELNIDQIVVGGDVVVGPMSKECLDILMAIDIPTKFIYGNCEVAVLNHMNNKPIGQLPKNVLEDIKWTSETLSQVHKDIMNGWHMTTQLNLPSIGKVLFCHATPRNENEIFTRLTPENALLPIFEKLEYNAVVCGHTHMQFDMYIGKTRIINAGSIGMPFGRTGAHWLLIDNDFELRSTTYDLKKASDLILKTDYPNAEDFASNNILKSPTEETMLNIFKKAELR